MNQKIFIFLMISGMGVLAYMFHSFVCKSKQDKFNSYKNTLHFKGNHEFVILQITDLHYGENEEQDLKNDKIQEFLIDFIQPNLIVNTGDAISGYAWDQKEKGFYERNWKRFTNIYNKKQIPYAYTLGNHDIEADASLDDIANLERSHPFSLFNGNRNIDPKSLSNYLIHIYSAYEGSYDQISTLLWIFDSKKECQNIENGNGCIDKNQLQWYETMSKSHLNPKGEKIEGMAFFHVPIQEYMNLWNYEFTFGIKDEDVSCPIINTNVFDSFKKTNNIKVISCGHDHNNNYGGNYYGIDLIFGQKTGYGSYGPSKTLKGGRVFVLKEKMNKYGDIIWSYRTYIVYEDGTVVYPESPKWQGDEKFQIKCVD